MPAFIDRHAIALVVICCALPSLVRAQPADAKVEKVVVKSTAHFDFGDAAIRSSDRDKLLAEVAKMKGVTWQTVTATGYTDNVGPRPVNERLSRRRAASVKAHLVGNGLAPTMIRTQGRASNEPVAPNTTDDGRASNRRTEVQFEGVRTVGK